MHPVQILVADDETEIRDLLKKYLERETYRVTLAPDGEQALLLLETQKFDLALLDVMMPKVDGLEVCRRIRLKTNIPVLMLTAKDQEIDKVVGLSLGADDYITKPFSINELVARVKAHLRRFQVLGSEASAALESSLIRFGEFSLDIQQYSLKHENEPILLTAKEFELLKFLASHPQQVFTKAQLFRQVWDADYIEDDNTIMVHISRLRYKIESDPANPLFIQTVWGIGYKFNGGRDE
ncbi:MAG: response regulator transcription factor [Anaerolineae bacterium]|nr:response regulator transcription factor [Anaerolineae bacterium]